jgi:hypothetical protein
VGSQINATVLVYDIDLVHATYLINFSGTVENPNCCTIPGSYGVYAFVDLFLNHSSAIEIVGATGSPDVTFQPSQQQGVADLVVSFGTQDVVNYPSSSWSVTAEVLGMSTQGPPNGPFNAMFLETGWIIGCRDSSGALGGGCSTLGEGLQLPGEFDFVPEPNSSLLCAVGITGLAVRRHRAPSIGGRA